MQHSSAAVSSLTGRPAISFARPGPAVSEHNTCTCQSGQQDAGLYDIDTDADYAASAGGQVVKDELGITLVGGRGRILCLRGLRGIRGKQGHVCKGVTVGMAPRTDWLQEE